MRTEKSIAIVTVGLVLGTIFAGMTGLFGEAEGLTEDWIEGIIKDTQHEVYTVAIGDADNDGNNEVVIGMESSPANLRAYENIAGVWVEDGIATVPRIYAIAIGDADNDGHNEVVVGTDFNTNEIRAYEKVAGVWVEEIIADVPDRVYSLAIGDVDNDGYNEVAIGMRSTTNEVRAYKDVGPFWAEYIIADVPNHVRSVAVGDADHDGNNEVVIGMWETTNEVRAYERIAGVWVEDIIADMPGTVSSVAIGDADNDGNNEVVIGSRIAMNQVRAYERVAGVWVEDIVADMPGFAMSVAVGDVDNDGNPEIAVGMYSLVSQIRAYENIAGLWKEEIIADVPENVQSIAIGDADNDGNNEVVIGMWETRNEVRIYAKDLGEIVFISHKNGDYVSGTICFEVAVTSNYVKAVRFHLNDLAVSVDTTHPYQFILDTSGLMEDSVYTIKAEGLRYYDSSINATLAIIINNFVQTGDYITTNTPKTSYEPDQEVSLFVGIKSPPTFDSLNLVLSYVDPGGSTLYTSNESLPYNTQYIVRLPLPSDAVLGNYLVAVDAYGYDNGALKWHSTNSTTFIVIGKNLHGQLEAMNTTLYGMNLTLNGIQNRTIDIQFNLGVMNLTEIERGMKYLNSTLPVLIDNLSAQISGANKTLSERLVNLEVNVSNQLAGLNSTLLSNISNSEANILNELAKVNASLSTNIRNLLTEITIQIVEMNSSISNQLTGLVNNITANLTALRTWLEVVLGAIDSSLTGSNRTMHNHLTNLETMTTNFHTSLQNDLSNIMARMEMLENNLSAQHDASNYSIKIDLATISDLISSLGAINISDLSNMISDLSLNLSAYNTTISEDLLEIDTSIAIFEDAVSYQLTWVNSTLEGLGKLDNIIADLNGLDQSLQSAEEELSTSVEESSNKEMSKMDAQTTLLVLLIILVITSMAMNLVTRKKMGQEALRSAREEKEILEEDEETELEDL